MKRDGWVRDAVRRLHAYVPGEQPPDGSVIKLNTNENPYPPSPAVEAALRAFPSDRLRRYPPPDNGPLRRRIASLHGCAPEQVFAGNGSDEVLALCTRAFVEEKDRIGYFEPSYSLYPVLADIRAAQRHPVALGEDFSWRSPPLTGIRLFFLTNPNAPTGMRFPRERVDAFCEGFEGVVLIDEAYVDFANADCMDLALRHPNVLVSRTLSKSYALAGLRVGYAVGAPPLIEALSKLKDSYNLDALAQTLAEAALGDPDYMRAQVARIVEQRERVSSALRRNGFRVFPSESNFLWVRPPDPLPAVAYFDGLRRNGILVRYFPGDLLGDYVRMTIGTPDEMTALLRASDGVCRSGSQR